MPESIRGEPAGDAKAFAEQAQMQTLLIIAALISIYIVLGRTLRKPRASADDHLDAAVGRARRIARP